MGHGRGDTEGWVLQRLLSAHNEKEQQSHQHIQLEKHKRTLRRPRQGHVWTRHVLHENRFETRNLLTLYRINEIKIRIEFEMPQVKEKYLRTNALKDVRSLRGDFGFISGTLKGSLTEGREK